SRSQTHTHPSFRASMSRSCRRTGCASTSKSRATAVAWRMVTLGRAERSQQRSPSLRSTISRVLGTTDSVECVLTNVNGPADQTERHQISEPDGDSLDSDALRQVPRLVHVRA